MPPTGPSAPSPPAFVMWSELPADETRSWERQWFGHELTPEAAFNIRGIGIREPLFNPNVHRPLGTGDWLLMLFHEPARLDPNDSEPSAPAMTMVIWPPSAEQFYSWGKTAAMEPHSWMHVEGTWVEQQIEAMELPIGTPFQLPNDSVMVATLTNLFGELQQGQRADAVILQNHFENWARGIRRQIQPDHASATIPPRRAIRIRLISPLLMMGAIQSRDRAAVNAAAAAKSGAGCKSAPLCPAP